MSVEHLLLIAGLLVLVGTASSKFSSRFGVPLLLLFIGIGMLAGSEGIGRIGFTDYKVAHFIATLGLAVILFDGGLRTSLRDVRPSFAPSVVLATVGVVITAGTLGLAATVLLDIPLLPGLLLGSIVASTDAAAVFTVLRGSGLNLPKRVTATLELESGLNDPMAIFLTIGLLEVLLGRMEIGAGLGVLFLRQMVVGGLVGYLAGKATVWLVNLIDLDAPGLYPVMTLASGVFAFGLAGTLGGSGFLAVYLAGMVVGNTRIAFQRGVMLFMDGAAWLAQITMFVLLGMLSSPSRIIDYSVAALLVTFVLIIIARPLAVFVSLAPFRYRLRELTLISWAGLKGAVPIMLATYPLLLHYEAGEAMFNVVFFVVLLSTIAQTWTLPLLARRLGLHSDSTPMPPMALEISSIKHLGGDIVDYPVASGSRVAGRRVRDLALPDDAVVAMIARGRRVIPPRGSTRIEVDDHVFFVIDPEVRPLVDRLFTQDTEEPSELPTDMEFPISGNTTVAELEEFYGISIDAGESRTLDQVLRERLGSRLDKGRGVRLGDVKLRVREVSDGHVTQVGMVLVNEDERP